MNNTGVYGNRTSLIMRKKRNKNEIFFFLCNYKTREWEQMPRCFQSSSRRKLNINRNLNIMPTTKNRVPFVTNIMTCSNMPTHSSKYVVWAAQWCSVFTTSLISIFIGSSSCHTCYGKQWRLLFFDTPPPTHTHTSPHSKNPSKPDSLFIFIFFNLKHSWQVAIHMRKQFSRCGNSAIQNWLPSDDKTKLVIFLSFIYLSIWNNGLPKMNWMGD